jgi:hypothetical protein
MLSRPHPTLALRQSLDSAPGLPDTYDGEDTPSRSESRAGRVSCCCGCAAVATSIPRGETANCDSTIGGSRRHAASARQQTTAGYGWAKTLEKSPSVYQAPASAEQCLDSCCLVSRPRAPSAQGPHKKSVHAALDRSSGIVGSVGVLFHAVPHGPTTLDFSAGCAGHRSRRRLDVDIGNHTSGRATEGSVPRTRGGCRTRPCSTVGVLQSPEPADTLGYSLCCPRQGLSTPRSLATGAADVDRDRRRRWASDTVVTQRQSMLGRSADRRKSR